jgi:hypothetical protein
MLGIASKISGSSSSTNRGDDEREGDEKTCVVDPDSVCPPAKVSAAQDHFIPQISSCSFHFPLFLENKEYTDRQHSFRGFPFEKMQLCFSQILFIPISLVVSPFCLVVMLLVCVEGDFFRDATSAQVD